MMKAYATAAVLAAVLAAGGLTGGAALAADPVIGLWRTQPDRKDLVSDIRIAACGVALCGTVVTSYDRQGIEVTTPNRGKRLFWDLQAEGNGAYGGGTVHLPLLDVNLKASAQLTGDRLKVIGCKGPICDGQVWSRVR